LHHVVLERWSRLDSLLHRRDARIKLLAALVILVAIATTPRVQSVSVIGYALFLLTGAILAKLPLAGILLRAAVVLPFSGVFALISVLAGDPDRALAVVVKSCLSAITVLILVGTTPLPQLMAAAEGLGAPRMLVLVVQFLYRYLFVISEQGQHMRQAARCRGELANGGARNRRSRFQAASGALAVLFGRSYQRAEAIHRAMLARGFNGHFHPLKRASVTALDLVFLAAAAGVPVAVRLGAGGPL